jgi:hypothetical protein
MLSGSIKGRAEQRQGGGEGSQDTNEDEGFWGTENEREGHEPVGRTLKTREEDGGILGTKKHSINPEQKQRQTQ